MTFFFIFSIFPFFLILKKIEIIFSQENKGIRYTLNKGVLMCTHELVMRFDSDDIMLKDRIITQIIYMLQNPDCVLCGADVYNLNSNSNKNQVITYTNFSPVLTWDEFVKSGQIRYTLSHPTFCFRKSKMRVL